MQSDLPELVTDEPRRIRVASRSRSRAIRGASRSFASASSPIGKPKPLFDMARFTRNLEAAIDSIAG